MAGETSSILRGAGAALLVHALATSAVAAGTRTAAGRAESEQRVASAPGAAAPGDTPPEEPRIPLEARTGLARPPVLPEATLAEAQAAAARLAAGSTADDESRLSRARSSHWAPLLRAQLGSTDTARSRTGQQLASPVRWDEQGAGRTWSVAATWDLGQLIFSRDESHLALLRSHLARRRQEVAEHAAQLYAERQRRLRASSEARGAAQVDAALELLRVTAALDALTGGLFRDPLARAQAAADRLIHPLSPEEDR